jgi:hypothetical protein
MRFFVTGEQHRQLLMNAIILMFLVYIVLLWLSNAMIFFHKMNLSPQSVVAYYLGSERDFTQPKSYQSLLEVAHFHLFAMGLLVLTLTHLMLMTGLPVRLKIWVCGMSYASAVANEAGGWLVRFVDPAFAYFKIGAFVLLELSLAFLVIVVGASLIRARHRMRTKRSINLPNRPENPTEVPGNE